MCSVLAVPPGFDGLLYLLSYRFVAPCSRPWGSPCFRFHTGIRPSVSNHESEDPSRDWPPTAPDKSESTDCLRSRTESNGYTEPECAVETNRSTVGSMKATENPGHKDPKRRLSPTEIGLNHPEFLSRWPKPPIKKLHSLSQTYPSLATKLRKSWSITQ